MFPSSLIDYGLMNVGDLQFAYPDMSDLMDIREWVQSQLPKNDALGFSSFLVDSLKELLSIHSGSLVSIKDQLELFYKELESLQPFLKDVAEQGNNEHDEIIHNFAERVIDKAYEVEYIIDSFVDGDVPETFLTQWLSEIIREIKLIRAELTRYKEKKMTFASPASNEELVGFEDVRENIMGRLLGGSPHLDVVSIIGMAGSGKTTLARSLINDPLIASHFDFQAECRLLRYTRVTTCYFPFCVVLLVMTLLNLVKEMIMN